MNTFFTVILAFIIVLGPLIFVHELGHFLFAKLCGVKVLKFSLGFGKKIIGKKWGETEYLICAIPLGGYVKMYGEQPGDEIQEEDRERSFTHKTVLQRFSIVFAGPLFNLLFAVVVFFALIVVSGLPVGTTQVGGVSKDSAAAKVGLKGGDRIVAINNQPVDTWREITETVRDSDGQPLSLRVKRADKEFTVNATPTRQTLTNIFGEKADYFVLGIMASEEVEFRQIGLSRAVIEAGRQAWDIGSMTVLAFVKMIQRIIPAEDMLGGPIMIAQIAGKSLEAGWWYLFNLIGVLSVNLGLINLVPIPILDGGHLAFLSLEALRRKPLSEQTMEIALKIGILLLGTLMLFVFYNDIAREIKRWLAS